MGEINAVLSEKLDTSRWLDSSKQCYDVMYTVARTFQAKKVLEIGAYEGSSAIAFCQGINDNNIEPEMYSVDAYFHDGQDISDRIPVYKDTVARAGFGDCCTLIHGRAEQMLPELFNENPMFDIIFIDADHSISAVYSDFEMCRNHANIFLFHDVISHKQESFLKYVRTQGFDVILFPTKFVEGDGHDVGIALAVRR